VSEVLKIGWHQIDTNAGEIRLDVGATKNKEGRVFPFTAELRTGQLSLQPVPVARSR
jgi:hypothetical protein